MTLEKKWNQIWNKLLSENKNINCLLLPVASLATAVWSLPYYQILNKVGDLRREKSHYHPANGYKFVLRFHFWCSCDNFTCYASAFKPLTAGAQRFPSGILREYASDIPIIKDKHARSPESIWCLNSFRLVSFFHLFFISFLPLFHFIRFLSA